MAGAMLTAVVFEVLQHTVENDHAWNAILAFTLLPPIALILFSILVAHSFHPATLVAHPGLPAFEVPANPGVIIGVAGYTFIATSTRTARIFERPTARRLN